MQLFKPVWQSKSLVKKHAGGPLNMLFSASGYRSIAAPESFLHNIAADCNSLPDSPAYLQVHTAPKLVPTMGSLSNTFIKSLLGLMLLCVFTLRPCAALVRNVAALKNLGVIEKGMEEPTKEAKENKEDKGRYFPDYELPVSGPEPLQPIRVRSPRPLILAEVHGCPGPVLRIPTPPPDPART